MLVYLIFLGDGHKMTVKKLVHEHKLKQADGIILIPSVLVKSDEYSLIQKAS